MSLSPRACQGAFVVFVGAAGTYLLSTSPLHSTGLSGGISALSGFFFFAAVNSTAINTFGPAAFFIKNSFTYLLESCSLPSLLSSGASLQSPRRGCSGDALGA